MLDRKRDAVPSHYTPASPMAGDTRLVLQQELNRLTFVLRELVVLVPQAADEAPEWPRRGMQRYAISPWEPLGPGTSPVWVQYDGTTWVAL